MNDNLESKLQPNDDQDKKINEPLSPQEQEQEIEQPDHKSDEQDNLIKLKAENEQLQEKVKSLQDDYLRSLANLENFKKRANREKSEHLNLGQEIILRELIDLADDLQRGKEHLENSKNHDDFMEGLNLIDNKVHNILNHHNIEPYGEEGDEFDPQVHEAIGSQKVSDSDKINKVLVVVRRGFLFKQKVLRAAQVIVGIEDQPESENDSKLTNNE
ncbi:MAG: nucleotide exchange factor GrpE [bacterium]